MWSMQFLVRHTEWGLHNSLHTPKSPEEPILYVRLLFWRGTIICL